MGIHDGLYKGGCGGLSLGSGDTDKGKLIVPDLIIKHAAELGHGSSHVVYDKSGHLLAVMLHRFSQSQLGAFLTDVSYGSTLQSFSQVFFPEVKSFAHEKCGLGHVF